LLNSNRPPLAATYGDTRSLGSKYNYWHLLHWGAYNAFNDPLAGFEGPLCGEAKGGNREGKKV